jgi:hypothetical protein
MGSLKEPKWINVKIIEKYENNTCLVEAGSQKVVVNSSNIKKYEKVEYDFKKGKFSKAEEFIEDNWENLKSCILDAIKEFLPNEEIEIDEKEKIIYACNNALSIDCGIFEKETISSFIELPEWQIVSYKTIGATRWSPEDIEENVVDHSINSISAAKIFIDSIWSIRCSSFWDNKFLEKDQDFIVAPNL